MIWTRSGTVWNTHSTTTLRHTCRNTDNIWSRVICVCVCVPHTFLKRSSVSEFRSHSSVMSTTAPCTTPEDKWKPKTIRNKLKIVFTAWQVHCVHHKSILTVVLLSEQRASGFGKELSQIVDFSHDVNSAQSSLKEQRNKSSAALHHTSTKHMTVGCYKFYSSWRIWSPIGNSTHPKKLYYVTLDDYDEYLTINLHKWILHT